MSDRQLLTQSEALPFHEALDLLAQNLKVHINHSLSKAHGINARLGNYYDSGGDLVGNIVLEFATGTPPNMTIVYAPAMVTALAPGSTGDGLIRTTVDANGVTLASGVPTRKAALATKFADGILEGALAQNTLILDHSRIVHGDTEPQAHNGVIVLNNAMIDTLAHTVGRRTVRFSVGGVNYELAADPNMSGPPQSWRGFNFNTNTAFTHRNVSVGHDNEQTASFYYKDGVGTLPRQVVLQINSNADGTGTWTDVAAGGGSFAPVGGSGSVDVAAYNVTYPVSPYYTFTATAHTGSDNSVLVCTLRVKAISDYGSSNLESFSNTCAFYANDEDGCGFISGPGSSQTTW